MRMLSEEEVDRLSEREAIEETREVIDGFQIALQEARGSEHRDETLSRLRREANSLRLKVQSVSLPGLPPLISRLDDYLAGANKLDETTLDGVQTYVDRIDALLDGEEVVAFEDVARVVREMPHMPTFEVGDIEINDVEVMVVMPQRSAARVVQRELGACGFRTTVVTNPLEAIGLIIETKPELVITAMVMPRISGADLCCALAAMPATKHVPTAVLTSLDPDHPDLNCLPMTTGRIRRGSQFGDDLADVLHRFEIT